MRQLLPAAVDQVDLDAAYALAPQPKPHVRANFILSADGAATFNGVTEPLATPADRNVFRTVRGLADVILVGAGTVRAEGYGPARPTAERRARRLAEGYAEVPTIAVVSRSLDLDLSSRFFTEAAVPPIVITFSGAPAQQLDALHEIADVLVAGETSVDLRAALQVLHHRGLTRVLTEGGPLLFGELIAANLVDELCLTLSPVLAGAGHLSMASGPAIDVPHWMSLVHVLEEDGALFLRYARREETS